jgi:uncharacterized Zn finger protein
MNLASALAPFVDLRVRKRGLQYFRGGRVELVACGAQEAKAVVTGTIKSP